MKNKLKFDAEKNGYPYKWVIRFAAEGPIKDIMEKPKLSKIPKDVHTSGAHLIPQYPERNHWDHYKAGSKWIEKKNRIEKNI